MSTYVVHLIHTLKCGRMYKLCEKIKLCESIFDLLAQNLLHQSAVVRAMASTVSEAQGVLRRCVCYMRSTGTVSVFSYFRKFPFRARSISIVIVRPALLIHMLYPLQHAEEIKDRLSQSRSELTVA